MVLNEKDVFRNGIKLHDYANVNKFLRYVSKGAGCRVCKKTRKLKLCGGCKEVYYCSRECQCKDWLEHKAVCKK